MPLLDDLRQGKILVSDGATGTLLMEKGLRAGECGEEWNVTHPSEVVSIAEAYYDAGADLALTNTFGALRTKLRAYGRQDRAAEFAAAGARLAKRVCPHGRYVAGSIGPTGEFLSPVGTMSEEEMARVFAETVDALAGAGVDALCFETFTGLDEARCAVRTAKERTSLPVICTMTFEAEPRGFFTTMGATPAQAAHALAEAGADIIGTNCGNGIENMIPITRELRAASGLPILVHANAGLPQLIDGKTHYLESPDHMARHIAPLIEAGANIVGGCCGTTPEHIRAVRRVVDSLGERCAAST
jgi:5-methyltetrahydrofolate--homocysteine methyltransferase